MVNPRRKNLNRWSESSFPKKGVLEPYNQIILLQVYPHPLVALAPHIKEPSTISNVPNLLILMQMLMEEHLNLLLVNIPHLLGRNSDHIAILVTSLFRQLVDILLVRKAVVQDAEVF